MKKAAITIDVETDWGGRALPISSVVQGLAEGLPKIVNILAAQGCPATFFISASLLEKQRGLNSLLPKSNFEIASHGYEHNLDYAHISTNEHLYQLEKSKDVLESVSDKKVTGFRTPQFRLHPDLFKNLQKAGYHYDSSVVLTTLAGRYKYRSIYLQEAEKSGIKEIPVSAVPFLRVPFGLLWLNLIGVKITEYSLGYRQTKNNPLVMYAHPFDVVLHKVAREKISWKLKCWYNFKAVSVAENFAKFIEIIKKNHKIETMNELVLKEPSC